MASVEFGIQRFNREVDLAPRWEHYEVRTRAGMTVLAIISLALVPRINAARDEGEAGAARFESLHRLSVLLTVLILLAGIVVLVLIAGLAAA